VEKILYILEPEVVPARGPPLFIDPDEVIFHNQPTLWYHIFINILEIVD
jgi:hypothetical protein